MLLSIAHGEAMSPEFQEGFYDAVSTYVRTRNPDAFADDLEDAVSKDKLPRAKPDRRCRAYQAKCVTGRAKRWPSELVVGQIAIDGSSERRRVSGSGARSGRAVEASRADAAHSHNVGEIRGPHTTELAQRRSRIRVNWALAAGTWQRVTPRSRAVRGPPQPGMRRQWRPMSRLWLRRPLPASCAIGWACQACGRALIDARVRHHRRRQTGGHVGVSNPACSSRMIGAPQTRRQESWPERPGRVLTERRKQSQSRP